MVLEMIVVSKFPFDGLESKSIFLANTNKEDRNSKFLVERECVVKLEDLTCLVVDLLTRCHDG